MKPTIEVRRTMLLAGLATGDRAANSKLLQVVGRRVHAKVGGIFLRQRNAL